MKHPYLAAILAAPLAWSVAPAAHALTIGTDFVGSYTATDLGSIPGLPSNYGGLTFLAGTTDTLLIGGNANTASGLLYTIGVVRDPGDGSITGFTGTATAFGSVGEFNDGGVTYGPGGVLFTSRWPSNQLGQTKPGSSDEDRIDDLGALGVASSHAAINFVPAGFGGAGQAKIVSWSGGQWYDLALAADGAGTFDLLSATQVDLDPATPGIMDTLPGGPEGFVYISALNAGFSVNSLLVSDFSAGRISAYELDANGNPLVSTRRDFLTGLTGAEGALIDPVTGDFLFSTFGGGDRIVRVDGFVAPPPPPPPPSVVPLPAAGFMLLSGLIGFGFMRRKNAR